MAVGFAVAGLKVGGEDARQYGGRVTAFVVLSCVTAAMGGAIFGYDIGTAGGVSSMDTFLREFFPDVYRRMKRATGVSNYCKFDSQLLTLFTSSLYITGLLTAVLLASWLTARRGRRPSMVHGGVAYLAGAAVSGGAVNVFMAILGRALLGVGLCFANQYFLAMLCRLKAWLFFFFAGWIVAMTAFVYLFLPETKGLPIEHINKVRGSTGSGRRL